MDFSIAYCLLCFALFKSRQWLYIYIYICFVEVVPRSTGDQIKTSKPCKSAIYVRHISKEKKKDAAKIKHTCKQVVFFIASNDMIAICSLGTEEFSTANCRLWGQFPASYKD